MADKTGTVTRGEPALTDLVALSGSDNELLALAASAESGSEHPVATAILKAAKTRGLALDAANSFEALPGQGLRAVVSDRKVILGSPALMESLGIPAGDAISITDPLSSRGSTPILVAVDGKLVGVIGVADAVRPESRPAVAALRDMGLDVVMLTGDNERTARSIAEQVGITSVIAHVLPAEKAAE